MRQLNNHLPSLYSKWLSKELLELPMNETKADCVNCTMACSRQAGDLLFHPDLKCCTYYPYVANFLVGAILEQGGEGARRMKDLILTQPTALPVGLCAPADYQRRFLEAGRQGFGREISLVCPFYETTSKACTVWSNRPGECSSFFCQSSYEEGGMGFWQSLSQHLFELENGLAQMAMIHAGFTPEQVESCLEWIKADSEDEELMISVQGFSENLWADKAGNQEEFYLQCWSWARALKPEDLDEMFDGALDDSLTTAIHAHGFMSQAH